MIRKFWLMILVFFWYIGIKFKLMSVFESYVETIYGKALTVEKLPTDSINVVIVSEAEIEGRTIPLSFMITLTFIRDKKLNEISIRYNVNRSAFPSNFPHQLEEIPTEVKTINLNRLELLKISTSIDSVIKHTELAIQNQYNILFH